MYVCVVCPVEATRQQESPIYLDEQIKHFFFGQTRSMEAYCNTPSSYSQSFDCQHASKTLATFTIHGVCAGKDIMEDDMQIYMHFFLVAGGGRRRIGSSGIINHDTGVCETSSVRTFQMKFGL